MTIKKITNSIKKKLLQAQKNEITEHFIYKKLASKIRNPENKKILNQIGDDELRHYNIWKEYTQQDVNPSTYKIWKYYLIARLFGLTFGLKLMENGELNAQVNYEEIGKSIETANQIAKEEDEHEKELINMIHEEKLNYVGSIVLGLSDALVELTGALAGLTLVLHSSKLIAITGLITGIAASLSMAASEYLSTKSENSNQHPLRASIYTGIAYIITVALLVIPYFVFDNVFISLAVALFNAVIVIFLFTYYISVAKDISFKKRFLEMAGLSLSVAALSFGIGFLVRLFLGIEI